jgi:hypothetical protein
MTDLEWERIVALNKRRFTRKNEQDVIKHALVWVERQLKDGPRHIPAAVLERNLGAVRGQLGKYLRAHLLLVERDYHAQAGQCRMYSLNSIGLMKLKRENERASTQSAKSNLVPPRGDTALLGVVTARKLPEVMHQVALLDFEYTERSSRLNHVLHHIPRRLKQEFWCLHGLPFDYDVSTCAPQIITQLAVKAGLSVLLIPTVLSFLQAPATIREEMAKILGVDEHTAKQLVNGLFNDLQISMSPYGVLFKTYGDNGINQLKKSAAISALHDEIKRAWKRIAYKTGTKLSGGKRKSEVYRAQERKVLDVVSQYLKQTNNPCFLEHDGWRTQKQVNVLELEQTVYNATGFKLNIKENNGLVS